MDLRVLERQVAIFGKEFLLRLATLLLAVVGLGGNGSAFVLLAALAGFRNFLLIDPDVLEVSNLNRFFLGVSGLLDVGKAKVRVAAARLRRLVPDLVVSTISSDVRKPRPRARLSRCDALVSAVDNSESRDWLQDFCRKHGKVMLDLGSGGRVEDGVLRSLGSRASLYVPGGPCLAELGFDPGNAEPPSQVSFVVPNVVAAATGLSMLLSHLSGVGQKANLAFYDFLAQSLTTLNVLPDERCPGCRPWEQNEEGAPRRQ